MSSNNPTPQEFADNFPGIFDNLNTVTEVTTLTVELAWPFCFHYDNRPWYELKIAAPSPEDATTTAENLVQLLNERAPGLGYRARFSAVAGSCPFRP